MSRFKFQQAFDAKIIPSVGSSLSESAESGLPITVEVIHAGTTLNYTHYPSEELKASVGRWVMPYEKPVLTHHNTVTGEPIGRVKAARFLQTGRKGKPCIEVEAVIYDEDAIRKIKDGRYRTVSVGGTAEHVICSICGTDLSQEWCDHWRGDVVDGKTVEWIMKDITWEEFSFVNVPADQLAGIVEVASDSSNTPPEPVNPSESRESSKGGSQAVNRQEQLESAKTKLTETEADLANMTKERNELKDRLAEAMQELDDLKKAKESLEQTVAQISEEKAALEKTVEENSAKVSELEQQVAALTEEKKGLLEQCHSLTEAQHRMLAEQVIELKISLGHIAAEQKEEALANHMQRSLESLQDTLADLRHEKGARAPILPKIENPGLQQTDENNKHVDSVDGKKPQETEPGLFEALKAAFSGNRQGVKN